MEPLVFSKHLEHSALLTNPHQMKEIFLVAQLLEMEYKVSR